MEAAPSPPPKLLIRHMPSTDEEDKHMIIDGSCFTDEERLVLDMYKQKGTAFRPTHYFYKCDGGDALGSYFALKYGKGSWNAGDPLSTKKEEDESDEEVAAFIRERRRERKSQYQWIVNADSITPSTDTAEDAMDDYVAHLIALADPQRRDTVHTEGHRQARNYFERNQDIRRRVLALANHDFAFTDRDDLTRASPFSKRQAEFRKNHEDNAGKKRRLLQQLEEIKQQLVELKDNENGAGGESNK